MMDVVVWMSIGLWVYFVGTILSFLKGASDRRGRK